MLAHSKFVRGRWSAVLKWSMARVRRRPRSRVVAAGDVFYVHRQQPSSWKCFPRACNYLFSLLLDELWKLKHFTEILFYLGLLFRICINWDTVRATFGFSFFIVYCPSHSPSWLIIKYVLIFHQILLMLFSQLFEQALVHPWARQANCILNCWEKNLCLSVHPKSVSALH